MNKPITFGEICAGIGGMGLGFEEAGMECRWMIEIDKQCQLILRKHFPKAKLYADATKEEALETVNIIAGGTPCQGFSIAGLRGGLDDGRSNLCLRFVKICDDNNPDLIIWENVPGCLSMPDNAFGCFLGALDGLDTALVHPDTGTFKSWWRDGECAETGDYRFPVWPRAGMVVGPKRTVAWRVIDSQYTGVPQRRERVYVVASPHTRAGSLGAENFPVGEGFFGVAAKILFESEMLRRHSAPSRDARKDVANTLGSSPKGSGWNTDTERMTFVPDVAKPLGDHAMSKGRGTDLDNTTYVPELAKSLKASQGGVDREDGHTLIPTHQVSPALQERGGKGADSDCTQAHVIVPPLTTRPYSDNDGQEEKLVVAFQPGNVSTGRGSPPNENVTPALRAENDGDTRQCVAFRAAGQDGFTPSEVSPPLASTYGVRRLVPVETERLQGFPDDWTLIGLDPNGKEKIQKDSPRYRQTGNAVTKNVALWLGRRIKQFAFKTP